ncbi:efflux RND transporter periplasmic adaptor subunit [Flavobacteriaceae bacterium F89]|uniref:Efflux RND transporter periplasmic adaptor subunit n=1 Tax=Cerina litoralis TaxID=2874477 RepID=A0AAE3JPF2_9FLAO|nr:efflux RND transporter periplasmic adaptor subunit [Cerina litoralis]MCG2460981.1 efflux RND transporter periplasmic adaptor subunit [Cerina litoralis]
MKRNFFYITLALLVGLLGGYFIFSDSHKESRSKSEVHDHGGENTVQMWTCSMHPQIMLPEPGDCPICGMDLIPANSSGDGLVAGQFRLSENAQALANIQTSTVGEGNLNGNEMKLSGKIIVNEDTKSTQPAHFDGRIEKLYVTSLGQMVTMGQPVADVYSPSLVSAQQELLTTYKMRENQPQLYRAVREKFKNWRIHDSQLDQIISTGKVIETLTISSHVTGIVTEILVAQGNHIRTGVPLFKVANLNTVWASFDAYENQIRLIKKGQKIKVTTNAYPNREFDAKISFINPVLDTKTRTVEVRAVLDNRDKLLKPGMFTEAHLAGQSDNTATSIVIPKSAVLWTGKRSVVYVKPRPEESIFEMREVLLGKETENSYEIDNGLKPGDIIVTHGAFTVDAAAQLQGKNSMMTTASALRQEVSLSQGFQAGLESLLPSYFNLKDALVASNPDQAMEMATALEKKLSELNTSQLLPVALKKMDKVKDMADLIAKNDDLEYQRNHFATLSDALTTLVSSLTSFDQKIFIQRCPMAEDHSGAIWLSLEQEIRNPYFGEDMMDCGSTIRELGR